MLTSVDFIVIVLYLVVVASLGIWAAGRQRSTSDYFLGGRNLSWWAVCFSVVATETSTLTVIGVPAVAYLGTLTFLQLTLGYLLGRIVVSVVFLPRYFEGQLSTAYAFLGQRYGDTMRGAASVTFLVTRLLADGVRLFATAIPLRVIADAAGLPLTYFEIIAIIGGVTILYTFIGGIKAVVWMDVVQMSVYVGGALIAVVILLVDAPPDWWQQVEAAGKTQFLNFQPEASISDWLTQPYAFITAVLGGSIFSMASHGTDQLIVQRLLACRSLRDSQKALIGSGIIVMAQFTLFLFVGLLLWVYYDGASLEALGLRRGDEVFPMFIIEGLPPGLSGLILAGIVAAAMSTLSSSLNALASSSMLDLYERWKGSSLQESRALLTSRVLTLVWGIVFIFFANLFEHQENPVVELGLSIASFTYGGLLGVFLLGLINRQTRQADALLAFAVTIPFMVAVIFGVWHSPEVGWVIAFGPSAETIAAVGMRPIGWPWYTVIGSVLTLLVGSLSGLRHWLAR
jgi:solute:Na+ symporter, SSS family